MKVFGVKWARKPLWRFSAQSSSKKLRSLMLDQMAFAWDPIDILLAATAPAREGG